MEVAAVKTRFKDGGLKLLFPVLGSILALIVGIVGGLGMLLDWNPKDLPHLFFGLLVAGLLLFLFMLGVVKERVQEATAIQEPQENKYSTQIWPPPWSQSGAAVCEALRVRVVGLGHVEASERLKLCGKNEVEIVSVPGYWSYFCKEMYEPTQLLLICVGLLYIMVGSLEEGATAFCVIFLMAAAEVWTEWRAKNALSKLESSAPSTALVKREGIYKRVDSTELVPGDIVLLRAGMEVSADIRLLHSQSMEVDESKMSGESTPVLKSAECLFPAEASIFDWKNIVLAGSYVHRGTGSGVVYETGLRTYLGQVLRLASKKKEKKTALQKHLKQIAWTLSIAAVVASLFGAMLGVVKHLGWKDVVLSALSLAFATIPEELPILIAAVLAVGGRTLSKANVYVKNLRAAENLGYVNLIITDKTGTLTENRLALKKIVTGGLGRAHEAASEVPELEQAIFEDSSSIKRLLEAWIFMVDSEHLDAGLGLDPAAEDMQSVYLDRSGDTEIGSGLCELGIDLSSTDMFDQAVLQAVGAYKIEDGEHSDTNNSMPSLQHLKEHVKALSAVKEHADLLGHVPFDSRWKFAAKTFGGKSISQGRVANAACACFPEACVFVKGAPDILLQHCGTAYDKGEIVGIENVKQEFEKQVVDAGSKGFRLIGYACQSPASESSLKGKSAESEPWSLLKGCTFLGFLAFQDPVRDGVVDAIAECHDAGVRVIMVTGDHVDTARAVARYVGIPESEVTSSYSGVSCAEIALSKFDDDRLKDLTSKVNVFARATPNDKLAIMRALQASNCCVMAAGDGLNDAPILAEADVGIAMGKGTDVARKAASIVVVDDNFSVMPLSLAEGRRLLDNLRKAIAFYLGAKLGLLFLFIAGTLWQSFPLQAIHIIVLELFMDLGASTSFVLESADKDIMKRQPLGQSGRFFDTPLITGVLVSAASMVICVFGSFSLGVHAGIETAQTCAFMSWLLSHVMLALNMRTTRVPVTQKGWLTNPGMCVWFLAAVAFAVLASTQSFIRDHLKLVLLPPTLSLLLILICIVGCFWIEVVKLLQQLCLSRTHGYSALSRTGSFGAEQRLALDVV